jgi:hypothetical protein
VSQFTLQLIEEREKFFKPAENPNCTKDPFKTLFVGRLAFVTDEIKLKREFEEYAPCTCVAHALCDTCLSYGKIKSIKLVHDKQVIVQIFCSSQHHNSIYFWLLRANLAATRSSSSRKSEA